MGGLPGYDRHTFLCTVPCVCICSGKGTENPVQQNHI